MSLTWSEAFAPGQPCTHLRSVIHGPRNFYEEKNCGFPQVVSVWKVSASRCWFTHDERMQFIYLCREESRLRWTLRLGFFFSSVQRHWEGLRALSSTGSEGFIPCVPLRRVLHVWFSFKGWWIIALWSRKFRALQKQLCCSSKIWSLIWRWGHVCAGMISTMVCARFLNRKLNPFCHCRASIEGKDSLVPEDLLRVSIGIEDVSDLIKDLEASAAHVPWAGHIQEISKGKTKNIWAFAHLRQILNKKMRLQSLQRPHENRRSL